jgi:hypothetical protein
MKKVTALWMSHTRVNHITQVGDTEMIIIKNMVLLVSFFVEFVPASLNFLLLIFFFLKKKRKLKKTLTDHSLG